MDAMTWLVQGHYATPENDEDAGITTTVCETEAAADAWLSRYPDGTKTQVVEQPSEDSGGSSYLCECMGIDTGRHADWCHYLNLFVPVGDDNLRDPDRSCEEADVGMDQDGIEPVDEAAEYAEQVRREFGLAGEGLAEFIEKQAAELDELKQACRELVGAGTRDDGSMAWAEAWDAMVAALGEP